MKDATLLAGLTLLAAGTYGFRFAGGALRSRLTFPPRAIKLLAIAATVLLAALVTVTALTEGHGFAGYARPAGVLAGGLLAWLWPRRGRKAPFVLVVVVAAAVTAGLRAAGVR